MVYVTVKVPPRYHQMSLEELFSNSYAAPQPVAYDSSNTKTLEYESIPSNRLESVNIANLINRLEYFNNATKALRDTPREKLYRHFRLPKKNGKGTRPIDAPSPELKYALNWLKEIFETDFSKNLYTNGYVGALYHTASFGYVERRDTTKALKRHTANGSKWYAKFDLHNFFGSITLDFAMKMLSCIFPFSEVVKSPVGKQALETAIELGFLKGVLPQGSPLSPMLTNIIMVPFDFKFSKVIRDYKSQRFIYTRWADDFQVSSRYPFDFRDIEKVINSILQSLGSTCTTNNKTRYGSSSGRNWNLGLMINRDNNITIGHKRKRRLQSALFNFVMDYRNGIPWSYKEMKSLLGNLNYFKKIEPESYEYVIDYMNKHLGCDVVALLKNSSN